MTQPQQGSHVRVHYTGRLADGTVFDSSQEDAPLEFTIGQGQMIRGFEQGVLAMTLGESRTVTIPAAQAYGLRRPDRVVKLDRSQMPAELRLEVGVQVLTSNAAGRQVAFTVAALTGTQVTLDGNHPLAGKDLTFDIELVAVS
jgi:peptidylprolyl isomerase